MLLGTIILDEPKTDHTLTAFVDSEWVFKMLYNAGAGEWNFARSMEIAAEKFYSKDKKKLSQLDWSNWDSYWWDSIGHYAVSLYYESYSEARIDLLKMFKILIRNGKIQ
jgi:hypothetical protein